MHQQAKQGKIVQLNINSKTGDLAFFQNESGNIIHVGIIMENNFIIHSHGKVRIDILDNNGIFNSDIKKYSHKLKFVKTISKNLHYLRLSAISLYFLH